jgi:hypothetical protein
LKKTKKKNTKTMGPNAEKSPTETSSDAFDPDPKNTKNTKTRVLGAPKKTSKRHVDGKVPNRQ